MLFTKLLDWSGEQEFRFVAVRNNDYDGSLDVAFGDALRAVIVGAKLPPWQRAGAEVICREAGDVDLVRCIWHERLPKIVRDVRGFGERTYVRRSCREHRTACHVSEHSAEPRLRRRVCHIAIQLDPARTGVFIDDVTLPDGTSTSFETGLDGWTVSGPPPGSGANANDWIRTDASGFPVGASISTPDSVLMGFGFEGISTQASRNAVMRRLVDYLLR